MSRLFSFLKSPSVSTPLDVPHVTSLPLPLPPILLYRRRRRSALKASTLFPPRTVFILISQQFREQASESRFIFFTFLNHTQTYDHEVRNFLPCRRSDTCQCFAGGSEAKHPLRGGHPPSRARPRGSPQSRAYWYRMSWSCSA